jgi:antitoxin ParD1/3/4
MNINLKPEYEQFIQSQIANGQFATVDQVINEAVKLLEKQANQLEELKRKISLGTEQIKQGSVTDGEVVFERLQAKIRLIAQENE